MRILSLLVVFTLVGPTSAQNATQSASGLQPLTILQQSLAALVGNTSFTDVILTGTVRRIVGSDDETGSATLIASFSGSARIDLNLSSGSSIEVSNLSAAVPVGYWSGPDNVTHPLAFHNLLAETAWFSPGLAIARRVSPAAFSPSSTFVTSYVGHETLNGQGVEHISVSQSLSYPDPPGGPTFAHLSQVDFYLDSTTFLPAAISFNTHPDDNALLDLPVQVLFSDYRSVSGVAVPMHIQKYFNNSLVLDFQFQSASINSGLSATAFQIQ